MRYFKTVMLKLVRNVSILNRTLFCFIGERGKRLCAVNSTVRDLPEIRSTTTIQRFTTNCFIFTVMAKNTPGVLKEGEDPSKLSEAEWKRRLAPERYEVLREQGTERPFTGEYTYNHESGMYYCGCCGAELFSSDSKFDSGCGWPAFSEVLGRKGRDETDSNIIRREDSTHGMTRVEILCKKCKGHLGHVFDDGPRPTGERFCINSVSLDFVAKAKAAKKNGSKM